MKHDAHISNRLPHPPSFYLKKLYYDSVSYSTFSLHCLKELLEDSSDKIMFGTDCPCAFSEILLPSHVANERHQSFHLWVTL